MLHDFQLSEVEDLNNLSYCETHGREVCHDCKVDYVDVNEQTKFELPENDTPQYPRVLNNIKDGQLRKLLGKRWLDMQRASYEEKPKAIRVAQIKLPEVEVPAEVKDSPVALQGTLLHLFRQLQGMASTQRYYFANQSKILLQDYEIFNKAAVLYQEQLSDQTSRGLDLYALQGRTPLSRAQQGYLNGLKAKASVLSTFGFFLELNTLRTFWRAMELTVDAFILHIESFKEEADDQMHAQFRVNELRTIQMEVYQLGVFPFFPYTVKALEEESDIHLVIANPVEGLGDTHLSSASGCHTSEIKSALATFKFRPNGKEIHSREDDVMFILTNVEADRDDIPTKQAFLQKLIVKENLFRQKNDERVMRPPFVIDSSDRIPKEVFDAFKSNFSVLYRESIRCQWREEEHSLSGLDVARRFQHRLDIEKKKKKKRPLSSEGFEKADMEEVRSVPDKIHLDPSLFWEVGDGTLEKYVPPVVRKKIKTRKPGTFNDQDADVVMAANEAVSSPVARSSDSSEVENGTPPLVQRPLDQLKHGDFVTRDILWRKIKGVLKWFQLVQFLSRIRCKILNLDGSKRKIEDTLSGRCMVLHRPHPGDECRPDQRESYRNHIEDWLKIEYSHLVRSDEGSDTEMLDSDSIKDTISDT